MIFGSRNPLARPFLPYQNRIRRGDRRPSGCLRDLRTRLLARFFPTKKVFVRATGGLVGVYATYATRLFARFFLTKIEFVGATL